jgi:excisionase family DNA binding protein
LVLGRPSSNLGHSGFSVPDEGGSILEDEVISMCEATATGVRGALVEQLRLGISLDPFLSLKALASYSGLSVRKLREYLDDPRHPLPQYRVGGKILVRRSEFDAWIAAYRRAGDADVNRIVATVMAELN